MLIPFAVGGIGAVEMPEKIVREAFAASDQTQIDRAADAHLLRSTTGRDGLRMDNGGDERDCQSGKRPHASILRRDARSLNRRRILDEGNLAIGVGRIGIEDARRSALDDRFDLGRAQHGIFGEEPRCDAGDDRRGE